MKYSIGDILIDENGYQGVVCVKWNNGDLSNLENDAAHPNLILVNPDDTWRSVRELKVARQRLEDD